MREALSFAEVKKMGEKSPIFLDLDLCLEEGVVTAVIVASDQMKRHLSRLATGLESPDAGEIRWWGKKTPDALTAVLSSPALLPWKNVLDNMLLPLRLKKILTKETRERALELLEVLELKDLAKKKPRALTLAQQRQVAMIRAFAEQPRFFLLEDPFVVEGEEDRLRLQEEFLELWRRPRPTVLFLTSSVSEAVFIGERVLILTDTPGRVFEEVKVQESHPRTRYFRMTQAFSQACHVVGRALEVAMSKPTSWR